MRVIIASLLLLTVAGASPSSQRIVGGTVTTIENYPEMVALLVDRGALGFTHNCGGSVLNERSILSAAHCTISFVPANLRSRVGSTFGNSGGIVHTTSQIINHANYNSGTLQHDISIIRTSTAIVYSNVVQPARIAGTNYNIADNQLVWATGWGLTETFEPSEQLRHVQLLTINLEVCKAQYGGFMITNDVLCAGWLNNDSRGQCVGDSGGPLYHNGVVVGVCSFGPCPLGLQPSGNMRVSSYTTWIQQNA